MKSRYEFGDDDQYYEYLVHYYVGQITTGMHSNPDLLQAVTSCPGQTSAVAIRYAKAIVEQLKKEG